MTYDPTTPVDLVFGKIDDLLMYGDFKNCPSTATQAITKGYHILNNCEISTMIWDLEPKFIVSLAEMSFKAVPRLLLVRDAVP